MRLQQYITEMANEINLESGQTIDKKTMTKFKKKFKDTTEFINHIKTKVKLTSNDERRLKAAFNEDIS